VNGKEWKSNCVSNDHLFGFRAVSCYYYYNDGCGLNLNAGNSILNSGIGLNQLSAFGGCKLDTNSIQNLEFRYSDFSINGNYVFLDSLDYSFPNYFILSSNVTINYLIEGKFGCRLYNDCNDTVSITVGYFKSKFIL